MFAGSSALLLLIAGLFRDYWYLSFIALTPFLYRTVKSTPSECLRLAVLFGLSFFGASSVQSLMTSPAAALVKLFGGTALFALFGWAAGYARSRWGFSPSIMAMLWVALEIGLLKFGLPGGLPGDAGPSHPFLHTLVGLFGFLAVSAIIVFLNSLLVLAIVKTIQARRSWDNTGHTEEKVWNPRFASNPPLERVYLIPEGRAPPTIPKTAHPGARLWQDSSLQPTC